MSQRPYLLLIDTEPSSKELTHYFAQFNIVIKQENTLQPMIIEKQLPIAILIHCSFLKKQPEILSQFYNNYPVPLFVIRDTLDAKSCIIMLEAGADDLIPKPINPKELHTRIVSISRRILKLKQQCEKENTSFGFDDWIIDTASRQVFKKENRNELHLSTGEYDLLLAFIRQPLQILERDYLLQLTHNSSLSSFNRKIDVQISRLRHKLEINAQNPLLIKTIRNKGYMFMATVVIMD